MAKSPELPPKAVKLFKTYLPAEPQSPEQLSERLDSYLELVDKVWRVNARVDKESAGKIATVLKELLTSAPADKYKYVQAAARYFMEDEDAEGDLISAEGFQDDILVVNSVAHHLGRPELALN